MRRKNKIYFCNVGPYKRLNSFTFAQNDVHYLRLLCYYKFFSIQIKEQIPHKFIQFLN